MRSSKALDGFRQRFWEAYRERRALGEEQSAALFGKAADYAREAGLQAEARIADATRLEAEKHLEEALASLEAALADPSLQLRGLALFLKGSVLRKRNEHDAAIVCYRDALEDRDFDRRAYAWNNLAATYADKRDYDHAAECLRNALNEPSCDKPGQVWKNLGVAYAEKGEHQQAIECYQKALSDSTYDTPGEAWNNLGVVYSRIGEHDRAIECCQKALNDSAYGNHGKAWNDMGAAHARKGEHNRAIECFQKALAEPTYDTPSEAWSNLGAAYTEKGEYDRAVEYFQKALDDPALRAPGKARYNLGITYLKKGEWDQAIACLAKAVHDPTCDTPGAAWNNLGAAYANKGEYDEAIGCFHRAMEQPTHDALGETWNNLGVAHARKGDYHRAIQCYQKALGDPAWDRLTETWDSLGVAYANTGQYEEAIGCFRRVLEDTAYDKRGETWNSLGVAYANTGRHDLAIECFRAALDDRTCRTPSRARFNLGLAHAAKGDYAGAIECFRTVTEDPTYERLGDAWSNLGVAYSRKGDYDQAITSLETAATVFDDTDRPERASYTRGYIAAIRLRPQERSSKDQALLAARSGASEAEDIAPTVEERIRTRITAVEEDTFQRYARDPSSSHDDVLAVLKGWGSAVPLVEGGSSGCRGGGYLLKYRGKGLVIDPGFDFLRNFRQGGFHCREIHVVAVTHNHLDHNQDLRSLDDIFYEVSKRAERREDYRYVLLWDRDTERAMRDGFDPPKASHRREPVTFDLARVRQGYEESIDLRSSQDLPFNVRYFPARHGNDVRNAVGIRVECYDDKQSSPAFVLGFSSDTKFEERLCSDDCLGGADVLIAHISQPDLKELDDPEFLKETHLGYRGVQKLIGGAQPRLTIVCEFWAGLADLRIELVQGLRRLCGTEAILPGGIGLLIRPDALEVQCTTCKEWCPHGRIGVAGPDQPFGPLKYLCPDCRL